MEPSARPLEFKKAHRKVCCNCRQIAEELEGHDGLCKQTTTIRTLIKTLKESLYFKLYALKLRTLPLGADKSIFEQKGFWGLWESKIVSKREVYQNDGGELKGEAHGNSCRTQFKTNRRKGVKGCLRSSNVF